MSGRSVNRERFVKTKQNIKPPGAEGEEWERRGGRGGNRQVLNSPQSALLGDRSFRCRKRQLLSALSQIRVGVDEVRHAMGNAIQILTINFPIGQGLFFCHE